MDFDEYQKETVELAFYPGQRNLDGLVYVCLGLCGESGEVAEKVKKLMRDQHGRITPEFREAVGKELGDVLWYVSQVAAELDYGLGDIAAANIEKLKDRHARGTRSGSGDDR